MLEQTLKGKPASERAKIKGREIAKIATGKRTRGNTQIELVEINPLDNGVEVFARAWKNGKQVGFGDGTVDIERFVIINPPVLVEDPAGSIVRTYDPPTDTPTKNFREDPEEAILQVIEQNLTVMKGVHGPDKIRQGKRGRTTTTVYPDANPESTTVDGVLGRSAAGDTDWNTTRGASSAGQVADSITNLNDGVVGGTATTGKGNDGRWQICRGIALFDTSSIPDGDTISSATFSGYANSVTDDDSFSQVIVQSSPASNTGLVLGDWDQVGAVDNPDKGSAAKAHSSYTTSQYNDMALNATGIGWIDKTGVTKLGFRVDEETSSSAPTISSNGNNNWVQYQSADTSGTTQDPKLVVEHAVAATRRVFNIS